MHGLANSWYHDPNPSIVTERRTTSRHIHSTWPDPNHKHYVKANVGYRVLADSGAVVALNLVDITSMSANAENSGMPLT